MWKLRLVTLGVCSVVVFAGCSDDEGGASSGTGAQGPGSSASTTTGAAGTGGEGGTGAASTTSASGGTVTGAGGGASSSIDGYWVWTRTIEDGVVTLEVTDADMEPKVGPSGWPGCPEGILCTRYGIQKLAFGQSGRFHHVLNVTTSSDFQTVGSFTSAAATATFEQQGQFSCAHPESVNADVVAGQFQHQIEGGELWVSVSGFGGFTLADDGSAPTRWITYKPVSRDDYYGKYMIRICQPHDGFECHDGCFDASLVDEP